MESTTHHARKSNGHVAKTTHRVSRARAKTTQVARRALDKAGTFGKKLEHQAERLVRQGERRLEEATKGVVVWIRANPKTAAASFLAGGLLLGFLASTKAGRAALVGLGGVATYVARRLI
jgi:hypothetical protein